MKSLLRLLLKNQHLQNRSKQAQTEKGMTLVELLVGAIMAFLILTPMLGFVVDMLNTDRREQVKSNTEQDLQAAVDFIAQDLSQAIYIYDNKAINLGTVGTGATPAIRNQLPDKGDPNNRIPILVFWKRQQMKQSVPYNPTMGVPKDCTDKKCNDTYVLSLVAYYQFKETDPKSIWCQPSGGDCPTRIARYEIRDGVRDPSTLDYYPDSDTTDAQEKDPAFNPLFKISKPTSDVTLAAGLTNSQSGAQKPEVLVNYIDNSTVNVPVPPDCKTTLGVTDPPAPAPALTQRDLLAADGSTNSFYACVDTSKNIARVTIRGNSLRRLQADAPYNSKNPAYFPTATVQVQGLGARGQ